MQKEKNMDLEKVRRAFKRNRFECSVFETAGEAAEYLDGKIDGETVGFGDSLTLQAMGIYEKLSRHNTCLLYTSPSPRD